jgi:hypothetical protein
MLMRSPRILRYPLLATLTVSCLVFVASRVGLDGLMRSFRRIEPGAFLAAATALAGGFALSCWRLKIIAADLGYPMAVRHAAAALSLGQIGGAAFFQVIGQTIARGAFLRRSGIPIAGTLVITGYERIAAVAISVGLAISGALYLFGRITLDVEGGGVEFIEIVIGAALAVSAGAAFAWGRGAKQFFGAMVDRGALVRIARTLLLSGTIQLSTLSAYVLLAHALMPGAEVKAVAAASAVVMLAAALPISFAGWGIRELSTVYALGLIGFERADALAVAVLIGAVSMTIAIAAAVVFGTAAAAQPPRDAGAVQSPTQLEYATILAWAVPLAAATAVFFQLFLPVGATRLNVNLADPLAIVGAVVFAALQLERGRPPEWRLRGLNPHLCVMTGLLVISFVHGWISFGWTDWAFVNRTVGWFILLAYGATGALLVSRAGEAGFEMMLRTFVAVGLALAAIDLTIFILTIVGLQLPLEIVHNRAEGLSQNPNAFALQLMLVFAAAAALRTKRWQVAMLAATALGVWLTGSRAAWAALPVIALATVALRAVDPRRMATALGAATVVALVIGFLPNILGMIGDVVHWLAPSFQNDALASLGQASAYANAASRFESSNAERMTSLVGGWHLVQSYPLFGAGLGAFIEDFKRENGTALVIHSTPLWLAAELGIVGFTAFVIPFVRVLAFEFHRPAPRDQAGIFLILSLLAFGIISLAHDLLYQRALWLLAGAALAGGVSDPIVVAPISLARGVRHRLAVQSRTRRTGDRATTS